MESLTFCTCNHSQKHSLIKVMRSGFLQVTPLRILNHQNTPNFWSILLWICRQIVSFLLLLILGIFTEIKSFLGSQDDMLNNFGGSAFGTLTMLSFFPKAFNDYNLQSKAVQKLIHSKDLHFDVIVMEDFFSESFLAFAHKFNCAVVKICEFFFDVDFFFIY